MASFLDNTSDIILDAVLTDYGRQLLAKGDGSFNIVKFALGDDEIDYQLFDTGAVSPNQDTTIMATPVMEAFTNNAASMKSKLLTINNNKLLFLPILKLNGNTGLSGINTAVLSSFTVNSVTAFTGFVIPVDTNSTTITTTNALTQSNNGGSPIVGVLTTNKRIVVDQGLDSSKTDPAKTLKGGNLYETSYNVYIDSRLGSITGFTTPISVDDDGIATYQISDGNTSFFQQISTANGDLNTSTIVGNKGSRINFGITPSDNLNVDTYFNRLGQSGVALNTDQSGKLFKVIRSVVTVEGATTGYLLDIPIMFAKVEN